MRHIAPACAILLVALPAGAEPLSSRDADWRQLSAVILDMSKAQHAGKAVNGRFCEAELSQCTTFISAVVEGRTVGVAEVEDMAGRLTSRNVCMFNTQGDVRTCVDFDTTRAVQSVKGADGRWSVVK